MNTIRLVADSDFSSVMNNGMSIGERLANGGQMILVLMAFVFSVIFVIFVCQSIISSVIVSLQSKGSDKKKKDNKGKDNKEPSKAVETPVPVVQEAPASADDDVTVAVITAALTAYLAANSEDGTVLPFRVVSFNRKKSGKPWNS